MNLFAELLKLFVLVVVLAIVLSFLMFLEDNNYYYGDTLDSNNKCDNNEDRR